MTYQVGLLFRRGSHRDRRQVPPVARSDRYQPRYRPRGNQDRYLRDVIAQALRDPSVVIGLRNPEGFTDENGHQVILTASSGHVVADLLEGGERIAILQHDPSLLKDRSLLDSVASLAAVALSNTRLQHEVTLNIADVAASRQRLLGVADSERDRLEAQVQSGISDRLARVATQLRPLGSAELCRQLNGTYETARAFARGVYPRSLDEVGLAAIRDLDIVSGGMEVTLPAQRFPRRRRSRRLLPLCGGLDERREVRERHQDQRRDLRCTRVARRRRYRQRNRRRRSVERHGPPSTPRPPRRVGWRARRPKLKPGHACPRHHTRHVFIAGRDVGGKLLLNLAHSAKQGEP